MIDDGAGPAGRSYARLSVNAITTQRLSLNYGRRTGIEAVELDVPVGGIFGFVGPNGAGKTTTIRILLGMLRPSGGTAQVFGLDCWRQSHRIKRQLGYLPGDLRLYPWLTARSALQMAGQIRGQDLVAAGRELTERLRLDPAVRVRRMSRGMRQKLGLVLALAHRPRLLVLDEPTSGLDPLVRDELARYLRELASQGHTVFFSSHTLSEVEHLCDRVAIIRAGRIAASEPMDALRRRARRAVTLRFRDAAAAEGTVPPALLEVRRRSGPVWECDLVGGTPELVRWAAGQPIDDVSIAPPSLENLFQQYYQPQEPSP
jgi:ABC-2 type transport system ATP-binding protein